MDIDWCTDEKDGWEAVEWRTMDDGHRTDVGRTDERTDGQTNGRTDERTDRRTNGRTDRRTDGRTDERTDRRTNGRTDRRTDGRTNGRTDERTDGWAGWRTDWVQFIARLHKFSQFLFINCHYTVDLIYHTRKQPYLDSSYYIYSAPLLLHSYTLTVIIMVIDRQLQHKCIAALICNCLSDKSDWSMHCRSM